MYTLHNAKMDIHERYPYEIQHEIASLKNRNGKLRYFEPIVDYNRNSLRIMNECMSYGKTVATTIEKEDEQY